VDELLGTLPRRRVLLVLALLAALALVLRFGLHRGTSAPLAPPIPVSTTSSGSGAAPGPAVGQLVVDVVGAVRRPGLYHLGNGSRVADAVASAGGETRHADVALVNLAAPIADGEQVVVPARQALGGGGQPSAGGGAAVGGGAAGGPVHLNTATVEQLDALPGIGPVTAQKIVDYRQQHGAFSSVDELDAVPGIGPAKLDQLKGLVAP
jgi:competence protein ComEA